MYKLTIETKAYNRVVFEFENMDVLTDFINMVLLHSKDKDISAIVELVKEGEK